MMVDERSWSMEKRRLWKRLWEDLEIGYLDEDILPVLIEFFLRPHSFTISSCSGRITLSDSTMPWAREETGIVFKKHEPITIKEVLDVYRKPVIRSLWLNVAGPIIHVSALTMDEALAILRISREAGFKHSGILSINRERGVILELRTGVRMTQLLKTPKTIVVPEDKLTEVIEYANKLLIEGKRKLERLLKVLRDNRPRSLDEYVCRELKKLGHLYT